MTGGVLITAVVALHLGIVLTGYLGHVQRVVGGILAIAANYGLRRLLFLDPALAGDEAWWFGFILLGDAVFLILLLFSAARPHRSFSLGSADLAVIALVLFSMALAAADDRVPALVRLAHWKEEYFYAGAYFLVRLNGCLALRHSPVLALLAVLALAVALRQAFIGPLEIDLMWAVSGRSVLASGGAEALVGSHGLGNLSEGWLRPFGIFGNGTDFGVYMTAVGLLAVAAGLPDDERPRARHILVALLRPFPMLCLIGVLISVVRFNWVVFALSLCLLMIGSMSGALRRLAAGIAALAVLAGGAVAFFAAAPHLAGPETLVGRAFITGTYAERAEVQGAYLDKIGHAPSLLLTGEGFGRHGAAAAKFGSGEKGPNLHSRLFDYLQDGGLAMVALGLAPLFLALRPRRVRWDPLRVTGLSYCAGFLLAATLLGARSALLQVIYWSFLGLAVSRSSDRCGRAQ